MKKENVLAVLIVLISISSVLAWCKVPIGNTAIWWCIDTFVLILFYKLWDRWQFNVKVINVFLILVLCSAVYGVIEKAQIYWDYKLLCDNLMIFLLPLAAYAYMEPYILKTTLKSYLTFSPWLLLVLAPFLDSDAFGRFLVPYSFMALFFKDLDVKYRLMVIIAFIITIFFGTESRSDVIKFSLCICIAICFYYKKIACVFFKFIGFARCLFLVIPFVFFILGATNICSDYRLYVAFRWTFAWIEDFSKFDLNYLFLWIMVGICFSPLYRNMTDEDFKLWVKSIN